MIQAGFFTGQSLGDLVTLKRSNVDLEQNIIFLSRRKTGTPVKMPIAKPLQALLAKHWPKKDADYFWPVEANRYLETGATGFSQEFYELMHAVGLVAERDTKKKSKGKGRSAKRKASGLGFHNLRHTFVTQIKAGGAMDSVARELAGHGSNAISAQYTHLPIETLRKAITVLPEVGK